MAILFQVVSCDRRPPLDTHSGGPASLRRLIKACWRRNPRERPSSGEVQRRLCMMLKQLQQGQLLQ